MWNPKKYLNVYIGDIRNNKYSGTNGYVNYHPWRFRRSDAIALSYRIVGYGRGTLVHESGHWLGLRHIFSGSCRTRDGISDTPIQKWATGMGSCPTHPKNQCGHPIMFVNFMDYCRCRKMFTIKQVDEMYLVIKNHRKEFIQPL